MARPPLSLGELIEHWTLVGDEVDLVSAKRQDTRLTFALMLKFYGRYGRFPRSRGELHQDAVEFIARSLKADPASVAVLFCRRREITDALVNLLISTVHRIGARAERRVTTELVSAFRRVQGKEGLLFRVADAALARPEESVRRVVFPVVGEDNLRNLVAEYKSSGPAYRRTVQTTYRASYTNHYRAGLIRLLEVLRFRSEDSRQPVLEAVRLVRGYAASPQLTYYPEGETVPFHGGLSGDWQDLAYRTDGKGHRRVVRTIYEIRTFEALCDRLRCKGIWVLGAEEFRNPDEDLVTDFAERRTEHYAGLRKPLDPQAFIAGLQGELRRELQALNDAVPGLPWLEIAPRGRHGAVRLTPLEAVPEPANLGRLKKAIAHRWGMLPLIDVLKEAVLRSGCQQVINSAAGRGGRLGPGELLERLLLVIYAYGTGAGIRAVAAADRGPSTTAPRWTSRRTMSIRMASRSSGSA